MVERSPSESLRALCWCILCLMLLQGKLLQKIAAARCKLVELLFSSKAFPTKRVLGFVWLKKYLKCFTFFQDFLKTCLSPSNLNSAQGFHSRSMTVVSRFKCSDIGLFIFIFPRGHVSYQEFDIIVHSEVVTSELGIQCNLFQRSALQERTAFQPAHYELICRNRAIYLLQSLALFRPVNTGPE